MNHTEVLEAIMLLCFGASWPVNLVKSLRLRSAKSMSLVFLLLIWAGYIAGTAAKMIQLFSPQLSNPAWYLLAVYIFNLFMLTANLIVFFRNKRLDMQEAAKLLSSNKGNQ